MKKFAMSFGLAALLFSACSKKEEVECLSGLGGNLVVHVIPKNDGTALKSTDDYPVEVFIAFGQSEFPGKAESKYNKTVKGKNSNDYVNCHNLKCGLYYFYATYTDPKTGYFYAGGAPLVTDQQEGQVDLNIDLVKE